MEYRVSIWAGDNCYCPRAEFEDEFDARSFVEQITFCRHKLSRIQNTREVEILGIWQDGAWLPANVEF